MGSNGLKGSEAIEISERNANLLVTRATCGDPSAIPSISRILVSLQYPTTGKNIAVFKCYLLFCFFLTWLILFCCTWTENSRSALASVLESLDFCLNLRGSEAAILEQLSKVINLVDVKNRLVENNRLLSNHASCVQHEHERYTITFLIHFYLLDLTCLSKPKLKSRVVL